MSYIGRGIDQIDNISTLDNLSFNGSDATFNLTQNSVAFVPVSADALQIQIDGVIQSGNYTCSGSQVTFDFVPSGSSVCNGIKHFGVGVLTTVSDGAVTTSKLGNSAVTDAKISAMASSKLTGVVPTANLGSGTASSSTVLFGDQTFKTAPSGDLVHINTTSGTSSASAINIDNIFSSTYKVYKVYGCFISDTDNNKVEMQYTNASSGTATASSYKYIASGRKLANGSVVENSFNGNSSNSTFEISYNNDTGGNYSPIWFELNIYDPVQSFVNYLHMSGTCTWFTHDAKYVINQIGGQYRENFDATGLRFDQGGSGNFNRYFINTYGVKNSGN